MNMHKTEVEIVHQAYMHLWKQMQLKRNTQKLSNANKQMIYGSKKS